MLARELAYQLSARQLPLDAYYRELPHLTASERAMQNFDHPDSLEIELLLHHLDELISGRSIERPIYDFVSHTRIANRSDLVTPAPVLIVEGILALHYPELRRRYDLSIFVNTPAGVCLMRRVHRDVQQRGRTEQAVREQFAATTLPMAERFVLPSAQYASVTVEGTESLDWSVAAVLHALGRTLALAGSSDKVRADVEHMPSGQSEEPAR